MESVSLGEAWEPAFLASSQPKPASRAETCVVSQGPVLRRELNLVSWSTVTLLKLLIIFNLNLCFEGKAGWSSVACVRMEQMRAVQYEYACPSLAMTPSLGTAMGNDPWVWILVGVPQVSKQVEGNVLCQDLGRLGALTGVEPEYAVNQLEGMMC